MTFYFFGMWFYLFIFYYQKASSAGRDFIWFMLLWLCPAESSCSTNMCGMHEGVNAQRCQCPVLPNAVPQRRVPSPPLSLPALCFWIRPCVPPWEEKGKQDSLSLLESPVSMQSTHTSTRVSHAAQWRGAQDSEGRRPEFRPLVFSLLSLFLQL